MKKKNIDYEISSGNVFADIGVRNPEEALAKAELAIQINDLIEEKKLTQIAAAKLLDIDEQKVLLLSQGKLSSFSLERLSKFLNLLRQAVTIKVSKNVAIRSKEK
jgi:predicted XRE-type DNA-binding protein